MSLGNPSYRVCIRDLAIVFVLTAPLLLSFQLPSSQQLSEAYNREFTAELERLQGILKTANDKDVVEF